MLPVSQRVKNYFNDLYLRYQIKWDMDMSQTIYPYDKLIEVLFDKINTIEDLKKIQTIAFPSWSMNWNMDYAVPELYIKNKYSLTASLLDVRDCGILCVFYAFHILLKIVTHQNVNTVACCSIENAWLFLKYTNEIPVPDINYVGAIIASQEMKSEKSINILSCDIVNHPFDVSLIMTLLLNFNVSKNLVSIYLKRHSALKKLFDSYQIIEVDYVMSSGFIYYCLSLMTQSIGASCFQYALIIDHDTVHHAAGILFLKL